MTPWLRGALTGVCLIALVLIVGVAMASATTLMMPKRDALMGVDVVVWGNTTLANGTPFMLNCGDGSAVVAGPVADQSYISRTCNYASAGSFPATLTVGGELATAVVTVRDPAALSAFDLRANKINMAIEDGLRYLYTAQDNRAATFGTPFTSWQAVAGFPDDYYLSYSSLAILALENHGHSVLSPATDIYQPVVQRGLNKLFDTMAINMLAVDTNGNNPCVGVPVDADVCKGLGRPTDNFTSGYASSVIALAVAGSGAPAQTVGAGIGASNGGFVVGRTYAEILQRQMNTIMWGINDGPGLQRGGFSYGLDHNDLGDGSAAGWGVLALLDGEAAGATIPAWARTEVATYLAAGLNPDGSLKYQSTDASDTTSNFPKTGIGLEVMYFTGRPVSDAAAVSAVGLLGTNWPTGYSTDGFVGLNKGHSYGMFNAFKSLKLYGIQVLPGVGRAAGPGGIPADDWYEDYRDYLVTTQVAPNTTAGGNWSMQWSYCGTCDLGGGQVGGTAIAELILSPVALVLPANLTLAPLTATNPVGGTHTVTATATTVTGGPVPGATVTFTILSGPNTGSPNCSGTGSNTNTTDASGNAACTYPDTGGAGSDLIQANIGTILSNTVTKTWGVGPTCNGKPATIYVKDGKIVGGPDDGKPYRGVLLGTSGNDVIVGTDGADLIKGFDGDDTICGGDGDDRIEGGAGNDWIDGGKGKDLIKGQQGNDTLYGGEGNDRIEGGPGDDYLDGGPGNNVLNGETGIDTCTNGPTFLNCE